MRHCLFTLLLSSLAFAQSAETIYQPDINGRLVDGRQIQVGPKGEKTELSESVNGRIVPRENTETHILSESPTGRVIETITRKYGPDGQVASAIKTVSEEQKHGDATTIRATTSYSDGNGRFQEGERRTIETVKQGTTTSSDVTIARPGISGGFDTVEKRKIVATAQGENLHEDETVYRPGQSGTFVPAEREVREHSKDPAGVSTTTQTFRPDYSGRMELMTQEVAKTTERPDGSSVTERNIYGRSTDSVAVTSDNTPRIKEQQLITRTKGPGDTVVEVTTAREASPSDPARLGAPRKISETVCVGKCTGGSQP